MRQHNNQPQGLDNLNTDSNRASNEASVTVATADTGERKTGKAIHGNAFTKMLEVVFPDTAIGNDIAGALRAFQREHAGTGIRIVYKIAK